jgi:membrane protein DedA with SNARE-associated domain
VQLHGIFKTLEPLLRNYGYLAVAGIVFGENVGLPILPGETILIAAAIYAGAGKLNIVGVAAIALGAAVVGQTVGYLIGRLGGRRLVDRYGRYLMLTPPRLARAERFFDRRGFWVVLVGRFVEGLRQGAGIISGLIQMDLRLFLPANVLGGVLWVGVWAALGEVSGNHINAIYRTISRYALYAVAALVLLTVVTVVRHRRRRHAEESQQG